MPRKGAEAAITLLVQRSGITWELKWHGSVSQPYLCAYMRGQQNSKVKLPQPPNERLGHLLAKYPDDLLEEDLTLLIDLELQLDRLWKLIEQLCGLQVQVKGQ